MFSRCHLHNLRRRRIEHVCWRCSVRSLFVCKRNYRVNLKTLKQFSCTSLLLGCHTRQSCESVLCNKYLRLVACLFTAITWKRCFPGLTTKDCNSSNRDSQIISPDWSLNHCNIFTWKLQQSVSWLFLSTTFFMFFFFGMRAIQIKRLLVKVGFVKF